jgi:hypothetical protein
MRKTCFLSGAMSMYGSYVGSALAYVLLTVAVAIGCAPPGWAAGSATRTGAAWRRHDVTVTLRHLPERYSCEDLQHKFHDLLLALGARGDPRIVVDPCGKRSGGLAHSREVHLQFELLAQAQPRFARVQAEARTIRFSPGYPPSLGETDCELMQQIKDELFPETVDRIVSFDLACAAPRPGRWPFSVTVQTLTPSDGSSRAAVDPTTRAR